MNGANDDVTQEMLVAAMRAFEPLSSVLRYREKDKWHTCDMMAMREAIKAVLPMARQAASHGSAGGEPINDDMIERAIDAHEELFDSGDAVGAMRAALIAALPKLTAAGDDGDEPAMWVCLVDAPENGNKHIRAWTSHRERAERFQADGLEMLPLFLHPAQEASGCGVWRPIETAPKDECVMLCVADFEPTAGRWWPVDSCWVAFNWEGHFETDKEMTNYLNGSRYEPTHWMPLPDGPSVPSADRGAPNARD